MAYIRLQYFEQIYLNGLQATETIITNHESSNVITKRDFNVHNIGWIFETEFIRKAEEIFALNNGLTNIVNDTFFSYVREVNSNSLNQFLTINVLHFYHFYLHRRRGRYAHYNPFNTVIIPITRSPCQIWYYSFAD